MNRFYNYFYNKYCLVLKKIFPARGKTLPISPFPPIAIHFIWNNADNKYVEDILEAVRNTFSRDIEKPFSRGLNIPQFFYSSDNPNHPPKNIPKMCAEKNIPCADNNYS